MTSTAGRLITACTPTVVTHVSGVKFAIGIRSHQIIVDQTLAGGGQDSGPTPLELLGAALGSCIAYYIHHFLHTRGLEANGIRVSVSENRAHTPSRIEGFSVDVELPTELPEKYRPLLERVIHSCPAHNTLSLGGTIDVTFKTPTVEGVGV